MTLTNSYAKRSAANGLIWCPYGWEGPTRTDVRLPIADTYQSE